MELTVQNVYGLLLRSKLMPIDAAKAMFARWKEEAKDAGDLGKFASWMVANKYLTEYQSQLLARGHAEGFFLNEYTILDRLGKGRMAGVYKAQHQLGQIVAIKVLPPSKAKEANLLARFHREARLSLRLKHPNIVRTFQTGTAEELHYIVMEHLEGETLEDVLVRRRQLPHGEALRLIYQALQGLQHMHEQSLVHRDLKPANMMLIGSTADSTLEATLKILDIGLGRTLFEEIAGAPVEDGLTTEGVLLGTPDYMSPEQARDARTSDIRSDIYSLGCVLYHLLTGQPPFPDTNIISQMIRHATEPPRPLKAFHPDCPEGVQQILNWMMAKDAGQRYPTPERAAAALQVFLVAGGEKLAEPEADPQMQPYLNWLETDGGKRHVAKKMKTVSAPKPPSGPLPAPVKPPSGSLPTAAKPPSGTLPAAKPSKPVKLVKDAREDGGGKDRKSKQIKRKTRPTQVPSAPVRSVSPPPEPAELIDVELVPVDLPALEAKPVQGLRLNRREMMIFGVGAFLGAIVTFIGALLAFSRRE